MCHIPSLRLVWLYFIFLFFLFLFYFISFWRKEIQVYFFWMRLIAKDDIPPLHFLGWVIVVHVVIWMDFFLPVTWSSQSAEMEVNRVRLGIKKDPPIRSELSAVKGSCMSARSSGIFWRSFLFVFYFFFHSPQLSVLSLSPESRLGRYQKSQRLSRSTSCCWDGWKGNASFPHCSLRSPPAATDILSTQNRQQQHLVQNQGPQSTISIRYQR
jgi:hypothetical protein